MDWVKQGLASNFTRGFRAANRVAHPELDGHKFRYEDLREIWTAGESHMVCTHDEDRSWQYWHLPPSGAWVPTSVHGSRKLACAAAVEETVTALEPGTYVLARFPNREHWMRVRCHTPELVTLISGIFTRLDCETTVEDVDAVA